MTTTAQHPQYLIIRSNGATVGDGFRLVDAQDDPDYVGAFLIRLDASSPMPVGVDELDDGSYEIVGGYDTDSDEDDMTIEVIERG